MISKEDENINYKMKKISIKMIFASLFFTIIITNVVYGWAAPNIDVFCCQDNLLEYINNMLIEFKEFKNLGTFLLILFLISDFIFIYSIYKHVLQKGNAQFAYRIIIIIIFKMVLDITFYQKNIYTSLELEHNKLIKYTLINILNKNSNSLISLPISINFLCFIQSWRTKNISKLLKFLIFLSVFISTAYFLFSNLFFSFQIIFSLIIVDYIDCLIEIE